MSRLPTISGDSGTWGGVLNDFLGAGVSGITRALTREFIDWPVEYGVNTSGTGGESTNASAWSSLMSQLAAGTTRDGIRDIVMCHPGDVINLNTTCVGTDLVGVRFWFLSGPSFNESVATFSNLGYFRWTGAANTYMFLINNNGTNQRGLQWFGIWNMVTSVDQQGWGICIDNMNNWGGPASGFGFGSDGATHSLQRGVTCWSTGDDAHGIVGAIYSANVGQGAVYAEGGGFNVLAGNISHGDNQMGAVINGQNQRSVSDMATTNGSATITSGTIAFDSNWDPGRPISGAGIPAGAWIKSVTNATTAVMSAPATSGGTGRALTLGSLVPGSEMKFYPGVKFDGGTGGAGGAIGILCNGGTMLALGNDFEGYNGASRTVSNMSTTSGSTTITSATISFTSADAPSGPRPGRGVSGGNIPDGARIVSVTNSTTAVISKAATATGTNQSLTVNNFGIGIDIRRVDTNSYSGRYCRSIACNFTGHDGSMIPVRITQGVSNGWGNHVAQPTYSNCLSARSSDSVFVESNYGTVETWIDYYRFIRAGGGTDL